MRHTAVLAGLVASLALLPGCDLFKPATPEPPTIQGGTTNVTTDYSEPPKTLETMRLAIANKDQGNGADAWVGAFADPERDGVNTVFEFDPAVVQEQGAPPAWDLTRERNFYRKFSAYMTQPYFMRWDHWDPGGNDVTDEAAGTAFLPRLYFVYTLDATGSTQRLIARGIARLSLRKVASGRWVIVLWSDQADPDADPSDLEQQSFSRRRIQLQ